MSTPPEALSRRSPIHSWLEAQRPTWRLLEGCQVAISLQDVQDELATKSTLAICDLSVLAKLGIKGQAAADWLRSQQLSAPDRIYDVHRPANGGLIARLGTDEFLLESSLKLNDFSKLCLRADQAPGHVYAFSREDATLVLLGSQADQVLAQTCGVNFARAEPDQVILTRVAGVSCTVLPEPVNDVAAYRLWVDYTYAWYLWERLVEIVDSLGGTVIGAGALLDEL